MKTARLQAAQANGQSISNVERELLKGIFVTRSYASCLRAHRQLSVTSRSRITISDRLNIIILRIMLINNMNTHETEHFFYCLKARIGLLCSKNCRWDYRWQITDRIRLQACFFIFTMQFYTNLT